MADQRNQGQVPGAQPPSQQMADNKNQPNQPSQQSKEGGNFDAVIKDGVLAEDWMLRVTAFDESLRALPTVAFAGAGTDPNARTGLEAFQAARAAFHEVAERRMEDLQQALSGIEDSRKALRVYLDAARRAAMEPHYINRGY